MSCVSGCGGVDGGCSILTEGHVKGLSRHSRSKEKPLSKNELFTLFLLILNVKLLTENTEDK